MSPQERPSLNTSDTLDAAQLEGVLERDGIAELHVNDTHKSNGFMQKRESISQARDNEVDPHMNLGTASSEDEIYESYDTQKFNPDTVVQGSSGGQLEVDLQFTRDGGAEKEQLLVEGGSIPIRLERTKNKGRYMLTADDPMVRDILKRGLERQKATASGKNKSQKSSIRELVFTRRFTTFDRQNPSNTESPFLGFFVLFWISMVMLFVRVLVHNYRECGNVLGGNELLKMMFGREIINLAVTDGVMCATTALGWVFQVAIYKDFLDWNRSGWIIQQLFQAAYLAAVVSWTFYRDWPWQHTIFLVLHGLTFLMKQHSYAAYNGYLSVVYKRRGALESKLRQLRAMSPVSSPVSSPKLARTGSTNLKDLPEGFRHRRNKSLPASSPTVNLSSEPDEVASVADMISSGYALDIDQLGAFNNIITSELEAIDNELKGKCTITENYYPSNLTLFNWAEWTLFPTLVYELEYPRQEKINWAYVAEKTGAVFGVLVIMQVVAQAYIYPPVKEAVRMKDAGMSLEQRWQEFPYIVTDILFPLLLEQLLTWYLIWECVLNVMAELTLFADRGFYGNWWSSVSWDQYARDWNRPVHNFLLRHVYHSSISAFHVNKSTATFITFLLSAVVHELLMFCLFHKVRGYLFGCQLLQMPLVMLSRTKFLKGRNVLGNVIFWFGLFIGPAFITSLYLVV